MLRVLHITEESRGGGQHFYLKTLLPALSEHVEVYLICPLGSSQLKDLTNNGVTVHLIEINNIMGKKSRVLRYFSSFYSDVKRLRKAINDIRPDIIINHGTGHIKSIIAATSIDIPLIWVVHDSRQRSMTRQVFSQLSRYADHILFVSHRSSAYYSDEILSHINNSVIQAPIGRNLPSTSKADTTQDKIHLISVGYVNANKGYDILLKAITLLTDRYRSLVKLQIVGPVLESQQKHKLSLDRIIAEHELVNVEFLGFRDDIVELLSDADLYICSSRYEASPIAVWEALSIGLPIISTDVGDVKAILGESQNYICKTESPEALSSAIKQAIDEKRYLDLSLKAANRKLAQSTFDVNIIAAQHLSLYKKVCQEKS